MTFGLASLITVSKSYNLYLYNSWTFGTTSRKNPKTTKKCNKTTTGRNLQKQYKKTHTHQNTIYCYTMSLADLLDRRRAFCIEDVQLRELPEMKECTGQLKREVCGAASEYELWPPHRLCACLLWQECQADLWSGPTETKSTHCNI